MRILVKVIDLIDKGSNNYNKRKINGIHVVILPIVPDQGSEGWQHFHGRHCSTTQTFLLSAFRVLINRCAKGESMSRDSCFIAERNPDSVPG
jgi:hypothetical protein